MKITTDFSGGNIDVAAVEKNIIRVKPQLRDTNGDWFYWAFRVSGAAGQTFTFDFTPYGYIGYYGPAVSNNLKEWRWLNENGNNPYSFTYVFGEHEDNIYFAHDMLYGAERFYSFSEKTNIKVENLCVSKKGRNVPVVRFGEGNDVILLTARHHCCESTGSYVLEGVLEELYNNPIPNCRVIAVPFVDLDGVTDGDQGKNRIPHDHNRDYGGNSIYASIKEIINIVENEPIKYAFDFHSPWHTGGRNDKLFFVRGIKEKIPDYVSLGEIFKEETYGEANSLKYDPLNDINPGEEWNTQDNGLNLSFSRFCSGYPEVVLALTLETPYFGCAEDVVSQKKLVSAGRAFARSVKRYNKTEITEIIERKE